MQVPDVLQAQAAAHIAVSGLDVDGRLGLTAIGTSPDHAAELYEAGAAAVHGLGAPV